MKRICFSLLALAACISLSAQQVYNLYDGEAPGFEGLTYPEIVLGSDVGHSRVYNVTVVPLNSTWDHPGPPSSCMSTISRPIFRPNCISSTTPPTAKACCITARSGTSGLICCIIS